MYIYIFIYVYVTAILAAQLKLAILVAASSLQILLQPVAALQAWIAVPLAMLR